MFGLLDRLKQRRDETLTAVHRQWHQLVNDVAADDASLDEESVLRDLENLGRTIDELEQAVALKRRRLAAVEHLQAADKAEREVSKADAAWTAVKSEYEQKRIELDTWLQQQHKKYAEARESNMAALSRASNARYELLATCPPELRDRERQLLRQRQEFIESLTVAEQQLRQIAKDRTGTANADAARHHRDLMAEAEDSCQRIREQLEKNEERLNAVREQMLHP